MLGAWPLRNAGGVAFVECLKRCFWGVLGGVASGERWGAAFEERLEEGAAFERC